MTAAIFELQQKTEAKFICSACGADRGCQCNAPAVEKLAEIREQTRQRVQAHRERKAQEKQEGCNVTDNGAVDQPRTGLDGKTRKMPERAHPDPGAAQINSICNSAYEVLSEAEGIIDGEISLEDDAREALANALYSCGDSLKRLAKTISRREN